MNPFGRLALLVLFLAGSAMAAQPPEGAERVAVEAYGLAVMDPGRPPSDAHREALADAAGNAVLQACVEVETGSRVEDARMAGSWVRMRAGGRLERMDVLDAGVLEGTRPPIYRVAVRAIVVPAGRPAKSFGPSFSGEDAWRPRLRLMFGERPAELPKSARDALASRLRAAGIRVLDGQDRAPALRLRLTTTGRGGLRLRWRLDAGPSDEEAAPAVEEQRAWLQEGEPPGEWWDAAAAAMAVEAYRLWLKPRHTRVVLHGLSKELADGLGEQLRRGGGYQLEEADAGAHAVQMPIAGEPGAALRDLLAWSGAQDKFTVRGGWVHQVVVERVEPQGESDAAEAAVEGSAAD